MPGTPTFVEAWWDETRKDTAQRRASEEGDVHPVWVVFQEREKNIYGRVGTRTGGAVEVEVNVDLQGRV